MVYRVFPRKTNATPDDDCVRFDEPGLFDNPDKVMVSVTWTWDKPKAEKLADSWARVCNDVTIGGPAYNDKGGEFTPGIFVKPGYVITSRGCPNKCWFCSVPKREGGIRELKIHDGYNLLDSNILACSENHINAVFEMLKRQKEKAQFTGGLEAKLMKPWIAEKLAWLKPKSMFFAYDTPDDYEPLVETSKMLKQYEIIKPSDNSIRCYVLIGYHNDSIEKAKNRLIDTLKLGFFPMAMLYNGAEGKADQKEWKRFQREWANPTIIAIKKKEVNHEQ
jgi:hypothetical protein